MGVILVSPGSGGGNGGTGHSHDNMAVLNSLTLDGNNHLRLNGHLVGEEAVEVTLNTTLTAQDIAARYFELPDDCDTDRALNLILESLPQRMGDDWEVVEKTSPEKDRVVWAGLGMERIAQAGDRLSINYYVKR